jgi:hypothetical protein
MDQSDVVVCAAILQQSFVIPQRDFKLALGFIVCNGIAIHKGLLLHCSRFYANVASQQQVVL